MATIFRRVSPTGSITYQVKVRIRGEKPRSRTFRRKADAEAWSKAAETDMSRGVYVPTTVDRRRIVSDLIDVTIRDHLPTKRHNKSAHKVEAYLEWWKRELGELRLDALTPARIGEARARLLAEKPVRGDRRTPATVNRYLAGLSVATKYGWKELGWLPSNPVLAVSKGAESSGVVRFLSDEERRALLRVATADSDANVHTAIVLALATGLRASNLRMLTWADVDFRAKALHVGDTKNGEARWVPLVAPALAELKRHRDRDPVEDGWVFKSSTQDVPAEINGGAWMRVKAAAGLVGERNVRFHDLRHTAGTYLNEAGASAIQIAAALGHKTLAMAKRYSHQSPEFTRSVFDRLTDRLGDSRKSRGRRAEKGRSR